MTKNYLIVADQNDEQDDGRSVGYNLKPGIRVSSDARSYKSR
jgi:hypothetical protein